MKLIVEIERSEYEKHKEWYKSADICSPETYMIAHGVPYVEDKIYDYKVVRSYASGCAAGRDELSEAFNEGYEFVRASDIVKNDNGYSNYIEYIVRKEKNVGGDK